jgi:hypothetical protein
MAQHHTAMTYDIAETGLDPIRQWELIGRDANGVERCCVRFKTYGEAWREAERRKQIDAEPQATLPLEPEMSEMVEPLDPTSRL